MSNKLGAFVVGGLVGAAVALLYAPRTGVETRALVTEKMNTAWGGAQDFGAQAQVNAQQAYQTAVERGQVVAQDVAARGQSVAQNVAARGQEIYGQAQARVQEAAGAVRPVITDKNDQLHEKIEAARRRRWPATPRRRSRPPIPRRSIPRRSPRRPSRPRPRFRRTLSPRPARRSASNGSSTTTCGFTRRDRPPGEARCLP